MKSTNRSLKEWNATIEALGHGKQTILIRNYKTNVEEFLLYPTFSYALVVDYLNNFQSKYQTFVEKNAIPERKNNKILLKYFVTVEDIIEKPLSKIPSDKYYIWTRDHVKKYISGKTAFIWVLRVYQLKEPYWAEAKPFAITYANLKNEISLDGMKPVLSDPDFIGISDSIR